MKSMTTQKKAIVTGSSGFVGRALVKRLEKEGYHVVTYSRSKGQDILNREDLVKAAKGCDLFFHLAAELEEDKPLEHLRNVNVKGTSNALWAARENHCERFIFLSSVGVYGRFDDQAHEMFPYNPTTNYELSKKEAEELVMSHSKDQDTVVVRSALVMGPNKYWKEIVKTIQKGFPIIGSGHNKWQIVYLDDLVDAIVFLAKHKKATGIYNVAEEPTQAQTLRQLVELIHAQTKSKKEITHIPVWLGKGIAHGMTLLFTMQGKKTILRPEYVDRLLKNRHYSIEKIKALGWKPKTTTIKAIEKTLEGLRD